tara:strand:+ start:21536 stop:22585 length:1050 start_codon:yes stop_codon:yes gene_type:complete
MKFKIGKTYVGDNSPCFVVAELSGNHNGEFSRAKKMLIKAKQSGANAVKLQTYKPETITLNSNRKDFLIGKKSPWKIKKNFWSLYKNAFTPWEWHQKLFSLAKKLKIEIFSSPFDETAVDLLEKLRCPAYKIASAEINHIPLLERVAKTKKPVILSKGLATQNDIDLALKTLKKNGCKKIIILQCVSSYPSPINEQNLRLIPIIKKKYKVLSGLSDHTLGSIAALTSVALGGSVLEKHFNLNDNTKTVDSFFSLNNNDFKKMVEGIRDVETSLGKSVFKIDKSSMENFYSRRSIYVSEKILKNQLITTKNVKVVRPGYGLEPKFLKKILGKRSKKNLIPGTRFKLSYCK